MRRYRWETLRVDPTTRLLCASIRTVEAHVNSGTGRVFVDASPLVHFWQGARRRPVNWLALSWLWRGGMATDTYRSWREGMAVVGCAWVYLPDKSCHVRIIGERIRADDLPTFKRETEEWGIPLAEQPGIAPIAYVYPALWALRPRRTDRNPLAGFFHALADDPTDRASWSALHDLLVEQDAHPGFVGWTADAIELLDRLAVHGI